jgi:hypothetical protein
VKNGSDSRHEERGKHQERKDNSIKPGHSRNASRTHRQQSPIHLVRKFYASEESRSSTKVSLVRNQRRIYDLDSLQGELRKINPSSFDGEREMEDDVEI